MMVFRIRTAVGGPPAERADSGRVAEAAGAPARARSRRQSLMVRWQSVLGAVEVIALLR